MSDASSILALRAALAVSPENLPLRQLLAETLAQHGQDAEAETEFRAALALAPQDVRLKLGLARCFQRQGRLTAAVVLLEDVTRGEQPDADACLLLARLLLASGETAAAATAYLRAIARNSKLADPLLAAQLSAPPPPAAPTAVTTRGEHVQPAGAPRDDEDDDGDDDDAEHPHFVGGREREATDGETRGRPGEVERPKVNFGDVGGMNALKDEIRMKIITPLQHPELYKAYGKKLGGGILMYGPPGCGKTHLARATAGEVKGSFISVGISEVLEMWVGASERNLHAIFENARAHTPCVLFFDEVDALGASRTDLRHSAGRQTINQFLAEMDGVNGDNTGVLVLAATNAPWHIDPAFRRPGRFDRVLFVPPPDAAARAAILRLLLRDKPVGELDAEKIASKTDGFSGADLKGLVDQAVEAKLVEAMQLGRPIPLVTKDLLRAANDARATTREWFAAAKNYALFANQGGVYDDIVRFLKLK